MWNRLITIAKYALKIHMAIVICIFHLLNKCCIINSSVTVVIKLGYILKYSIYMKMHLKHLKRWFHASYMVVYDGLFFIWMLNGKNTKTWKHLVCQRNPRLASAYLGLWRSSETQTRHHNMPTRVGKYVCLTSTSSGNAKNEITIK